LLYVGILVTKNNIKKYLKRLKNNKLTLLNFHEIILDYL
jgi:hypothetical protein